MRVNHRGSKENRRRKRRAGQAAGLPQQGGSFHKHELEAAAIESRRSKLMQTSADLMKERKARARNDRKGGGED